MPADERVIRPGRNAWRVERASRATVLIDAAAYFSALRRALRKARHSIYIVGWDINSRVRLVGESGESDDGLPAALGAFLCALVRERPDLSIKLLLWDFSVVYSFEREPWPLVSLQWRTPPQIELCLDDALPTGSSHHQKIVVIDDAVAFCGGLDLTVRRWDRPDHSPTNPHRVDAAGVPYAPFHDVQLLVDGHAAKALATLVRTRWARAAYERLKPVQAAASDPWPEWVAPDFQDVFVAISRTEPAYLDGREVREVEALFSDMIDAAQRSIYIENQFLTCVKAAPLLAAALRRNPRLEMLIVAPKAHNSWIGERAMLAGRIRFLDCLRTDGVTDRVRVVHPHVRRDGESADVMVHSKVMIVDDRLLRIGSANLTNRSMGTDTECDLTIEAADRPDRAGILAIRNRLIAEHCGASPAEVQGLVNRTGSLMATVEALDGRDRRLIEIARGPTGAEETLSPIEVVADPERPIDITSFINGFGETPPARRLHGLARLGVAVAAIVLLILAWRYTQLSELTQPGALQAFLARIGDNPWTPVAVVAIYVIAGCVGFPVTALIAGTAVTFGAWPGLAYAAAGAMASAMVTYLIGSWAGTEALRRLIGPRLSRMRRLIAKRGILAIMSIRLVPIAPFTLVNLVAGALRIPPLDYVIGTALGLAPGLIAMSLLGDQIFQVLSDPSLSDIAIFVGLLAAWIGLSIGLQVLLARARGKRP